LLVGHFAGAVERGQHEGGFVGRQDDFEFDHATGQVSTAHAAFGWREGIVGGHLTHGSPVAAAQAFELGAGGVQRGVEQLGLGFGGGHAG
jgi:hypothetical protein